MPKSRNTVTMFESANGMKVTRVLAVHEKVQAELDVKAHLIGVQAQARLDRHHKTGASRVEVEKGSVDRFVVLNDERGAHAAMSIEKGRKPHPNGHDGMQGLNIIMGAVKGFVNV